MAGLFDSFSLRGVALRNRVVMSPMIQVSADRTGMAGDWHLAHYGARAVGGVGLVMVEATAVESRGRITEKDLGIYDEAQVPGLARVVDLCHLHGAKVGLQLAHAGGKAWSRANGIGPEAAVAPSDVPYDQGWPVPRALTVAEIEDLVRAFAMGAERAKRAGFDVIELHAAHGYLINQFLSPISNRRRDAYGGGLAGRSRFAREALRAIREVWGDRPLFVRVSASDYVPGGIDIGEMIEIARGLREAGADVIDVSSGGVTPFVPPTWPGYQVPFAEAIRREAGLPTVAVGLITSPEMADEIVRNGRADLVALGRELLRNPYWTLEAAFRLGVDVDWPEPYQRAKRR